jgi:hypothetical protein
MKVRAKTEVLWLFRTVFDLAKMDLTFTYATFRVALGRSTGVHNMWM